MVDNLHGKLKEVRIALSLKQAELAKHTGMSQRDVSLIENGRTHHIPHGLLAFYIGLGLDARYFYDTIPGLSGKKYLDEFVHKMAVLRITTNDLITLNKQGVAFDQLTQDYAVCIPILGLPQTRTYLYAYDRDEYLSRLPVISVPTLLADGERLVCFELVQENTAATGYVIARKVKPAQLKESASYVIVQGTATVSRMVYMGEQHKKYTFGDNDGEVAIAAQAGGVDIWQILWELRPVL
ncbi:MAG: helix-turn-helix transcriptional regulator [Cyclobacteriaceae bacterium]